MRSPPAQRIARFGAPLVAHSLPNGSHLEPLRAGRVRVAVRAAGIFSFFYPFCFLKEKKH